MTDPSSGEAPLINIRLDAEDAEGGSARGVERPLILVADDDLPTCVFIRRVLGNLSCDVLEAHDGSAALDLFKSYVGRLSLVILDVIMPGMDGERVLDAIRERDEDVRVIMISSEVDPGIRQELMAHGATAFVAKPLDTVSLMAAVKRLLPQPTGHPGVAGELTIER